MESLFKVNYLTREKDLLKEAFSFKKYKAMPKFPAIVMAVMMLPLQLVSAVLAVLLFIPSLLLRAAISAIKSLHGIVTEEGQKIKHATQLIVYIISWPIIIASYILAILWYVQVVVFYLLLECVSFIWSLGGFKFHAYVVDAEDKSIEVEGKYKAILPWIYVVATAVILIVIPLACAIFESCRTFVDGCGNIIWPNQENGLVFWDLVKQVWELICFTVEFFFMHIKVNHPSYYRIELILSIVYSFFIMSRPIAFVKADDASEETENKEENDEEIITVSEETANE